MGKRFIWTEEKILKWINNNNDGYEFVKIVELKGLYSRILFICPKCKREYEVCFKNFKKGNRCGCDNGKRNYTIKDVREYVDIIGYKILNDNGEYDYNKKFLLQCDKYHEPYYSNFSNLKKHKCPYCSKNAKLTLNKLKKYFIQYGYELLSKEYINANSKLKLKCPNSHIFSMRYSDFYSGKRCPHCYMSNGEQEIKRILEKYDIQYDIQYRFKDCKYKNSLPFDFIIFIDNYFILIEYDGKQHYTPKSFNLSIDDFVERKIRDGIKNEYCYFNNIPLIRIPYWDYNNIEEILIKELNLK